MEDQNLVTVFICFGFVRSHKEGYIVKIAIDDVEITPNDEGITLVSNPAKRQTQCWWAGNVACSPGSNIRVQTLVGARGKGRDTERTTDQWYVVEPEARVIDITVPKVGFQKYPLARGKFVPLIRRSEQDNITASMEEMLSLAGSEE